MILLALDTATPRVGVALLDSRHPGQVLAARGPVDARGHAELLAPGIESVLDEAGLRPDAVQAVAVGVGPGPFTGLRAGLMTARTLGRVLAVPVHGVCTLDALALGCGLGGRFVVVTDARRREVYWAVYDATPDGPVRRSGPSVGPPSLVPAGLPAVGEGAVLHRGAFPDPRGPVHPDPADIGRWVLQGRAVLPAEPLYLRRPDAAVPGVRKRVLT